MIHEIFIDQISFNTSARFLLEIVKGFRIRDRDFETTAPHHLLQGGG